MGDSLGFSSQSGQLSRPQAFHILVVDDDEATRDLLKSLLELYGHQVDVAEDGRAAMRYCEQQLPELLLMDITMPEMDGIQALKEIKKLDGGAKVIMCSAMGQQAMVIESIQAGAKDFIVKPFQAERVIEAVKKVVG